MTAKKDPIEDIRSDVVQEILNNPPNWMISWGITLLFLLFVMVLGISWFIKYPDVIKGNVVLTTEIPPVKLVCKSSGQLQNIYAQEGQVVQKGAFIAKIESPVSDSAIAYLQNKLTSVEAFLTKDTLNAMHTIKFADADLVFGGMQAEYNQLKSLVKSYEVLKTNLFKEGTLSNLLKKIEYYERLSTISNRQRIAFEKVLINAQQKYHANKILYEKEVISKMEFFRFESEWLRTQQEEENLKKEYVQNKITVSEYDKQWRDLTNEFSEKERELKTGIQDGIFNLNNAIHSWEQNHILTAPFSGSVSYLSNLSKNQFVQSGTPLFAIVPDNNSYVGYIKIPTQGFGKVKPGQQVHIKLDHYPSHQYGQVNAKVVEVTQMSNSDAAGKNANYLAKISLTNDFVTTFQKTLEFKPEMSGTAEIVTEDLRLLERIFSQIRKVFER